MELKTYDIDYAELIEIDPIRYGWNVYGKIYKENAKTYFVKKVTKALFEFISEIINDFGSKEIETVIDAGCGTGKDLPWTIKLTKCKKWMGIDLAETMLKEAIGEKKEYQEITNDYGTAIEFHEADLSEPLDRGFFPDKSIDLLMSNLAICYFKEEGWRNAFREFYRLLKPDRWCCVTSFTDKWKMTKAIKLLPKELFLAPRGLIHGIKSWKIVKWIDKTLKEKKAKYPSYGELMNLLENIGFREVKATLLYRKGVVILKAKKPILN